MATRARSRGVRYRTVGAAVLAIALVATACSSEDSQPALLETTVSSAQTALSGVSVASSSIEEIDVLRFEGLNPDDDLSDVELALIVDDLDPIDLLLFVDDGGVFAVTPLHPSMPGVGGAVTFRLSAGDDQVRDFDIELTGLPKSPGAWDDAIDSLLGELESRAKQLGSSLDEISGVPSSDLGDDAAAIKFIAGFLDDGSEDDLGSLLVRGGSELPPEQVELVDSIVAKLGLGHMNLPPLDLQDSEAMVHAEEVGASAIGGLRFNAVRAVYAQGTSCRKKVVIIRDGADLQRELAKGIEATSALKNGFFSDSSDYLVSNGLMLTGVAAAAFAATGIGAPAAGAIAGVGAVAGAMYATQRLALMVDAGSYPTSFASLKVETSQSEFNEDFTKDGQVTAVDVVAAATGLDAAQALAGLGAAIADGALGAAAGGLAATNRMGEIIGGTMGMSGPLRGTAQGKALESLAGDTFKICPQQWTVSINDSKYVRAWTTDGNAEVDDGTFAYRPLEVGGDTLWMETHPNAFPGASAITSASITTNSLGISSTESTVTVKRPGDFVDINAVLENADTLDRDWETPQGSWADKGPAKTTNSLPTRLLETPTNKDQFPFDVVIKASSKTGLRGDATDEITVTVRVELQRLIVSPDPGSVLINDTLPFTATDIDGDSVEVTWSATGGTMDRSSGVYEAGSTPGTYSVTATDIDDSSISETVVVNVTDKCMVGTWVLRSQDFFDQVGAQFGGKSEYRSGENRLTIRDDGTYTSVRDAWSFGAATDQGSIVFVIDAENFGTWTATDVDVSIQETGGDEVSVQMFIEVGGELQPLPLGAGQQSVPSGALATTAPYLCDAGELATLTDGVTSIFDRVDG